MTDFAINLDMVFVYFTNKYVHEVIVNNTEDWKLCSLHMFACFNS